MRVALIGASGNVGSRIRDELLRRGHAVTAIVRDPSRLPAAPGLAAKRGDVADAAGLSALLAGHDAVISAVRFSDGDPGRLIEAVRRSGVTRYLVVGGAASLEVAPGKRLLDGEAFPEMYRAEATKGAAFLDTLRGVTDLDWTFLSPSAVIGPGERTGRFRLGTDQLLVDAAGKSHVSFEDYAVALVDELERPAHSRQRFTVGY
ncbi:MAG TPA: NAD(P)-dependent oxidoreductase [Acetobacteraceae bacterium]|nr:NAD(P)-dependent oxidoreductase [Acetobacteraceae bacterium]